MFFWFSNDTFSIIDALTKLILVITGSALIICFCHRLTNFKKSRRYKYDFVRQHASNALGDPLAPGHFRQQPRWPTLAVDASGACTTAASPYGAPYDPYNSLRPALSGSGPASAYFASQALPLNASAAAYAGYHHPNSALAAYQNLSALGLGAQASPNGAGNQAPVASQQAQVYSTLVRPDCSGFQARQLDEAAGADDACPSYEEAVRGQLQQQQQQQQEPSNQEDVASASGQPAGTDVESGAAAEPTAAEACDGGASEAAE